MTTTTADVRAASTRRRWTAARTTLAKVCRQGATMVSAARHRYRRPALTISGFGCVTAAAWTTFGLGAGLLVLGLLTLVFEWLGGEE